MKNDFGFRIILACNLRHMTIAELQEKCSYASPLLAYCVQLDCPTLHLVYDLAEILDVSVLWLMGFNVDYENK